MWESLTTVEGTILWVVDPRWFKCSKGTEHWQACTHSFSFCPWLHVAKCFKFLWKLTFFLYIVFFFARVFSHSNKKWNQCPETWLFLSSELSGNSSSSWVWSPAAFRLNPQHQFSGPQTCQCTCRLWDLPAPVIAWPNSNLYTYLYTNITGIMKERKEKRKRDKWR